MFQNVMKQNLRQALEKVKIPGPISGVSKYWNSGLYREIIETDWNMKKTDLSPNASVVSKRFETKLKQALEKVKIPGPISGVSKHWNNGLYREIIETNCNMKKIQARSECFSCFETKLKQALEKVKIPDPISGVSKHWNNGLYREIIETDWNVKKIG